MHSDCQISVNTRKNTHISKKIFFLIYYVRNLCMLVLTRRNFLFSEICWKILIKVIFYLELKSDNVNTDKFSLTLFLPLFHSGSDLSYSDEHEAAKYKNIFLWSWNNKSKSPHPLLPTHPTKEIGVSLSLFSAAKVGRPCWATFHTSKVICPFIRKMIKTQSCAPCGEMLSMLLFHQTALLEEKKNILSGLLILRALCKIIEEAEMRSCFQSVGSVSLWALRNEGDRTEKL